MYLCCWLRRYLDNNFRDGELLAADLFDKPLIYNICSFPPDSLRTLRAVCQTTLPTSGRLASGGSKERESFFPLLLRGPPSLYKAFREAQKVTQFLCASGTPPTSSREPRGSLVLSQGNKIHLSGAQRKVLRAPKYSNSWRQARLRWARWHITRVILHAATLWYSRGFREAKIAFLNMKIAYHSD